jgi:PEP-CTERM motif
MKPRIASVMFLGLVLAAIPAPAQNWTYDNGPINGTADAWSINFGYIVSDTFVAGGPFVNGFSFGTFQFPGDVLLSVDWSVTSGENSGTTYGSGTASGANLVDKFVSENQFGYYINEITVTGLNVATTSGTTYWLDLQNAMVASGDSVFWDENSGKGCMSNGCPSSASESTIGTIPSESFTINGGSGGTTPEPSSFLLLASGILGLAGVLRRKLF